MSKVAITVFTSDNYITYNPITRTYSSSGLSEFNGVYPMCERSYMYVINIKY